MKRCVFSWGAALWVSCWAGFAVAKDPPVQEELTVVASKSDAVVSEIGSAVYVITAEEIERRQWRTVGDALQALPGVNLVQTGADGGVTTLFLRGANSQNTLVLLDGVRMNDASGVTRGYDFTHLSTAGVTRIELILGPQSVLYGSDASAGVVNIVTDSGQSRLNLSAEGSSEADQRYRFEAGDRRGRFDYGVHYEYEDHSSLSARNMGFPDETGALPDPEDLEEDGYRAHRAGASFGFQFSEQGRLELGISRIDADIDLDASDGDDPNSVSDNRQTALHLRFENAAGEGVWRYGLYAARSETKRANVDGEDPNHPGNIFNGRFEGVNASYEFRNLVQLNDWAQLLAGAAFEREESDERTSGEFGGFAYSSAYSDEADAFGLYGQLRLSGSDGWFANFGARRDDHSQFGVETTYQASAGWRAASGTYLRGFYGTGFQAPSLYQLYSDFGNPDLTAETSETWEAAIVQDLAGGRLQLGAAYFHNEFENLIDFFFNPDTFVSSYLNIDRAETEGYELFADARLGGGVHARLSYDDLDASDLSEEPLNGESEPRPLLRRYDYKTSLLLRGEIAADWQWHVDLLRHGPFWDGDPVNFGAPPQRVGGFTLVHVGLVWRASDRLALNLRAQNLFDEDYVQALGYTAHGRRIFLGLKLHY